MSISVPARVCPMGPLPGSVSIPLPGAQHNGFMSPVSPQGSIPLPGAQQNGGYGSIHTPQGSIPLPGAQQNGFNMQKPGPQNGSMPFGTVSRPQSSMPLPGAISGGSTSLQSHARQKSFLNKINQLQRQSSGANLFRSTSPSAESGASQFRATSPSSPPQRPCVIQTPPSTTKNPARSNGQPIGQGEHPQHQVSRQASSSQGNDMVRGSPTQQKQISKSKTELAIQRPPTEKVTRSPGSFSAGRSNPGSISLGDFHRQQQQGKVPSLIALDIDDCLLDLTGGFRRFFREQFPHVPLPSDQELQYLSGDVTSSLRQAFVKSPIFHDLPVVSGAVEAVYQLHAGGYRLEAVTARPESLGSITQAVLDRKFPGLISKIHYTAGQYKGDLCQRLGAWLIVDDSIAQVRDAVAHGLSAILFGPLNGSSIGTLPPNVVHLQRWQDAVDWINKSSQTNHVKKLPRKESPRAQARSTSPRAPSPRAQARGGKFTPQDVVNKLNDITESLRDTRDSQKLANVATSLRIHSQSDFYEGTEEYPAVGPAKTPFQNQLLQELDEVMPAGPVPGKEKEDVEKDQVANGTNGGILHPNWIMGAARDSSMYTLVGESPTSEEITTSDTPSKALGVKYNHVNVKAMAETPKSSKKANSTKLQNTSTEKTVPNGVTREAQCVEKIEMEFASLKTKASMYGEKFREKIETELKRNKADREPPRVREAHTSVSTLQAEATQASRSKSLPKLSEIDEFQSNSTATTATTPSREEQQIKEFFSNSQHGEMAAVIVESVYFNLLERCFITWRKTWLEAKIDRLNQAIDKDLRTQSGRARLETLRSKTWLDKLKTSQKADEKILTATQNSKFGPPAGISRNGIGEQQTRRTPVQKRFGPPVSGRRRDLNDKTYSPVLEYAT